MKYIKKEELIEGEIYKIFNINIKDFIYFKHHNINQNQINHNRFVSKYNQYCELRTWDDVRLAIIKGK